MKKPKTFVPGAGLPAEKKPSVAAAAPAGAGAGAVPSAGATNGFLESGQSRQDVEAIKVRLVSDARFPMGASVRCVTVRHKGAGSRYTARSVWKTPLGVSTQPLLRCGNGSTALKGSTEGPGVAFPEIECGLTKFHDLISWRRCRWRSRTPRVWRKWSV